jgi:hypothetical protein
MAWVKPNCLGASYGKSRGANNICQDMDQQKHWNTHLKGHCNIKQLITFPLTAFHSKTEGGSLKDTY